VNLKALWDWGKTQLSQAGIDDARWQAELLLRFVTAVSRAEFLARQDRAVSEPLREQYRAAIAECSLGVPLQYIVGHTEFFGREFVVTPAVLIPRPDTEILVEEALRLLRTSHPAPPTSLFPPALNPPQPVPSPPQLSPLTSHVSLLTSHVPFPTSHFPLLDLCAGSGCVGLTLAAEMPGLAVWLADVSSAALAVAADNAERLMVSERVRFGQGDLFAAVPDMRFGMITANPPYIPSGELHALPADVQREPRLALDGGADGLAYYRRIAREAPRFLQPGGWLLLEVGSTQADAVESLLQSAGFTEIFVRQDLAGRNRVVRARLTP